MRSPRDIDARIIDLAARTASVVHARDLRAAGVERACVSRRVRSGWMAPILPSTYAVGPLCSAPTFEMQCMAGVLHAGAGAVVDGPTAAVAIGGWNRPCSAIHVTAPGCYVKHAPVPFVFQRAPNIWLPRPVLLDGPVPYNSFVDMCITLCRTMSPLQLAFVIGRGRYDERVNLAALDDAIASRSGCPWISVLRDAVALVRAECAGTRSGSEDHLLEGLGEGGAPHPIVNTRGVMGRPSDEPDLVWMHARLNVEVDGRHHLEEPQRSFDAERDRVAIADGFRVMRIQARTIWRRRRDVVRRILRALDQDPLRGPRRILIE